MTEQTSVQLHIKNALLSAWDWFVRSEERLREEENEVQELRMQQLRAEEEAIEKYGSVKFSERGEELTPDLHFLEITDRIADFFKSLKRSAWEKLKEASEKSAAAAALVARISRRSAERAKVRAERMAEAAMNSVDDAGESIFVHLPESWKNAYLKLEDETVTTVEGWEAAVKERTGRLKEKWNGFCLRLRNDWTRDKAIAAALWKDRRRACVAVLSAFCAVTLGGILLVSSLTYYEYSYKGKTLGTVRSKHDVTAILSIIQDKMVAVYGSEVRINAKRDITFTPVKRGDLVPATSDEILASLSYLHDITAYGYAITADGVQLCILESEGDAKNVLRMIQTQYVSSESDYTEYGFRGDVTIDRVAASIAKIMTPDKALALLRTAGNDARFYTVAAGDTFSEIAKMAGLTTAELHALNPDVNTEKLKAGQELRLEEAKMPLTVYTVSTETYMEEIPYETVYTDTSSLYEGESTLRTTGVPGKRSVTATVIRENGIVSETVEIESTLIAEPVTQEVLRGTKEVPKREGTGTFIWPTSGYISSKFGMRWGRLHQGVDIAKGIGIPIYASDGGTVTTAGWENSYGYIVRISHGNGITTCYAHCSKLLVKVGEKVYQGQKIALMGSTGNSTGPHLHFEVRIDNSAKDPLKYLP